MPTNEGYEDRIDKLLRIGTALSSERSLDKLLEMILDLAREFTQADAGTLYLVSEATHELKFTILHNDTFKSRMGGTSGQEVKLPPVPLLRDGQPNLTNVAAYVANTGKLVNIPDVYEAEGGFDFTGPRKYDQMTGYRTKSMLCVPMRNHEDEIIGVLQLINAKNRTTDEVIPFASEFMALTESLASQAAVALNNAQLINDLKELFESFIKSIAAAIDRKSPYTGGHIRRVADLTMMIAHKVNEMDDGPFAAVKLTDDELEELRIAAWMHDIGKITTPEHVVDKATKLEAIVDRIELIKTRFDAIKRARQAEALQRKVDMLSNGADLVKIKEVDEALQQELTQLDTDLEFLVTVNRGGEFMEDEKIERLKSISRRTYEVNGEQKPFLTENEVYNLSIRKGTLNTEDRKKIEEHALVSIEMLRELPFPKKMQHVPEYAGGHHEKLNGKGYPFGLTAEQLPLQARIMAVADIFEALTAHDRPYKRPMPLSKAIQIMGFFVKDQELDPDVVNLFIKEKVFLDYAHKEMDPTQIDEVQIA